MYDYELIDEAQDWQKKMLDKKKWYGLDMLDAIEYVEDLCVALQDAYTGIEQLKRKLGEE